MTNEEYRRMAIQRSRRGIPPLLILLLAAGIGFYSLNRNHAESSSATNSPMSASGAAVPAAHPEIPKPSPIPKQQTAALIPAPAPSQKATSLTLGATQDTPSQPTALRGATAMPPVAEVSAIRPLHGMSFSAKRKGFNNGCSPGMLTLGGSRLNFVCREDQSKSVSVDRTQVKVVDNDGIELYSNRKYHFKIAGKSKDEAHRLFETWMSQAPVTLASAK
jgi:hypothetical protein